MTHSSPANAEPEMICAALIALTEHGIETDVQELLLRGNPTRGVAPGALKKVVRAVIRAQPTASPANTAASLRQQADLMAKANAGKVSAYVAIDDFDVDKLCEAADFIERISARQAASPANAGWTPDQFWEYVGGLAGEFEAGQMRDMMVSQGLSLGIRAQQMPDLELIERALEQAQDCIRGETPEDVSDEESRNNTIDKIRDALRSIDPAGWGGSPSSSPGCKS